jgi:hypothetical protein
MRVPQAPLSGCARGWSRSPSSSCGAADGRHRHGPRAAAGGAGAAGHSAAGAGLRPAADPLVRARATVSRLGLADRIALRQGEGLAAVRPDEVATVVIAGVGAQTVWRSSRRTSARPRAHARGAAAEPRRTRLVRRWLADHDFALVDERLTEDRERFYTVIAAEPGEVGGARDGDAGGVGGRPGGAAPRRAAVLDLLGGGRAAPARPGRSRRTRGWRAPAERRAGGRGGSGAGAGCGASWAGMTDAEQTPPGAGAERRHGRDGRGAHRQVAVGGALLQDAEPGRRGGARPGTSR